MLEKYTEMFKCLESEEEDIIVKYLKQFQEEIEKDYLIDLIEEIEAEVFYERAARKIEKKEEFIDASYAISILRKLLFK